MNAKGTEFGPVKAVWSALEDAASRQDAAIAKDAHCEMIIDRANFSILGEPSQWALVVNFAWKTPAAPVPVPAQLPALDSSGRPSGSSIDGPLNWLKNKLQTI